MFTTECFWHSILLHSKWKEKKRRTTKTYVETFTFISGMTVCHLSSQQVRICWLLIAPDIEHCCRFQYEHVIWITNYIDFKNVSYIFCAWICHAVAHMNCHQLIALEKSPFDVRLNSFYFTIEQILMAFLNWMFNAAKRRKKLMAKIHIVFRSSS